jgi:autotransporter-associated beta strand protein
VTVANNFDIAGNGPAGLGAIRMSGASTISGNIVLTDSARITTYLSSDNGYISGAITGGSTSILEKTGSGTLTFNGNPSNTFAGTYLISAGTLDLDNSQTRLAIQGPMIVAAGAYVQLQASNQIAAGNLLTINGTLNVDGYANNMGSFAGSGTILQPGGGSSLGIAMFDGTYSTFNGTVNITTTGQSQGVGFRMYNQNTFNTGGTHEFTGPFSEPNSVLAYGSNNYFNPISVVFSGTANAAIEGIWLGSGPNGFASTYTDAALEVIDNATLTLSTSGLQSINATNTLTLGGGAGQATLALSANWAAPFTGTMVLANGTSGSPIINTGNFNAAISGTVMGSGGLIKTGAGKLLLSGSNNYSGETTINNGTLQLGNAAALGAGGLAANGGTLDLAGYSVTVPSFSGAAGVVADSVTGSLAILTVNQSTSTTFAGMIKDGLGQVALDLQGGGTLTLSGTNRYTGGTTVQGGTLILTNNEAIADGSSLTVGDPSAFAAPVVPGGDVAGLPASVGAGLPTVSQPAIAPVPEPSTLGLWPLQCNSLSPLATEVGPFCRKRAVFITLRRGIIPHGGA